MLALLFKGVAIGLSIAAPVGPIGVLCIRRTLSEGALAGLASGLGAATADAVYGSMAAFGLSAVSTLMLGQQMWLRLIGGTFLCYLGVKSVRTRPSERAAAPQRRGRGVLGAYAGTFFLTLTNPMTVLSFAALGLASAAPGGYVAALMLVLGVFVGSALWWLLLSGGVSLLRNRATPAALQWVNWVSGLIVIGFGVVACWRCWGGDGLGLAALAVGDLPDKQVQRQTAKVSRLCDLPYREM
jgi:threonine/homoserine/homoserine lactone efflux protein